VAERECGTRIVEVGLEEEYRLERMRICSLVSHTLSGPDGYASLAETIFPRCLKVLVNSHFESSMVPLRGLGRKLYWEMEVPVTMGRVSSWMS